MSGTSPLPGALLLAAVAIVAIGAGFVPGGLTASNPKNVLLVIVDTLRADATSLDPVPNGAPDPTPELTTLRARSTVFSNAISQAPWTLPATASILTGKYPADHGARGFTSKLRERHHSLAEVLTEAGYDTGAVISNSYLRRTYGLDQGFQDYDETLALGEWVFWDVTSNEVTDRSIEQLRASTGRPFLLMAHYFDPHASYRDHDDRHQADGYEGWLEKPVHTRAELDLRINAYRLSGRDVQFLYDLYAEEVAHTDEQVGRLLSELETLGLADETAVVFVSDHGEEFNERGWIGHTVHLSDDMVRVPLSLALPGTPQAPTVERPVETRAIFQTLVDYLGVEPFEPAPGVSLMAAARGDDGSAGLAFTEVRTANEHTAWPARTALSGLRTAQWKLIYQHLEDRYELYDLTADPRELDDVANAKPERVAELRALLEAWMGSDAQDAGAVQQELSPEAEQQLRALGYID